MHQKTFAMQPPPGERRVAFVGDPIAFRLDPVQDDRSKDWKARLRTTLGRGFAQDQEIIRAFHEDRNIRDLSWQDLPMNPSDNGWLLNLVLSEPGFFRAKPYAVDPHGRLHWPEGDDFGISVHPNAYRTANTIYCAWTRLFGDDKSAAQMADSDQESALSDLDQRGYTVIPPSGKLRDLKAQLGHIIERLHCRILHLLPVNPTPTTFGRLGRFGSPYAALDLTGVDPALVEFDKRTTGVDQFRELTLETHRLGAKVFLDMVINHTGWGSKLHEHHPEWFLRGESGAFRSPGAWGQTWQDLVELNHAIPELARYLAGAFLTWCRRGVDGFRCDAGYMIPLPIWRYITARVRQAFPETIFLLEGLGGAWELTEALLMEGGMQWAYSELFQNHEGPKIARYLDYALRQSHRLGRYIHYSETHDNPRLAAKGPRWSLLKNQLCALTSVGGGFGFTCGVEWLARQKIHVHQRTGLNWGASENLVGALARLNELLISHPCFLDGATLTRLSNDASPVYALKRISAAGTDRVLVLINTHADHPQSIALPMKEWDEIGPPAVDLIAQNPPDWQPAPREEVLISLKAGAAHCLAKSRDPMGLAGEAYRRRRALAAWGLRAFHERWPNATPRSMDWQPFSLAIQRAPLAFLARLNRLIPDRFNGDLAALADAADHDAAYAEITLWTASDSRRVLPVPHGHWIVFQAEQPFKIAAGPPLDGPRPSRASTRINERLHCVALYSGALAPGDLEVDFQRYEAGTPTVRGTLRLLEAAAAFSPDIAAYQRSPKTPMEAPGVLLTNGRGGMARLCIDLGRIKSKYDCLLAANPHPSLPVDRHVLAKRARVWMNADGFLNQLTAANLESFHPGPPARWRFLAEAGSGRKVAIQLDADMLHNQNTIVLRFTRLPKNTVLAELGPEPEPHDSRMPSIPNVDLDTDHLKVSLTVRIELEDRSFHCETRRDPSTEAHFHAACTRLGSTGFRFKPAADRHLTVIADHGTYHDQPEWSLDIAHPVEANRGQCGSGDAFSPGWFEIPLRPGETVHLTLSAEKPPPSTQSITRFELERSRTNRTILQHAAIGALDTFGQRLALAAQAYVVRRGKGKTVIAGYPWFLDWGRDSLICARGLLACGRIEEVVQLLKTFGQAEKDGTLPNSIHGENTADRATSDAPLWYGIICADVMKQLGDSFLETPLDVDPRSREVKKVLAIFQPSSPSRTIKDVLERIARGYLNGTPNGVRVDPESGLVWSPPHFTWMDTNYPAATPREGYPIEIQVLWIRLLRLLGQAGLSRDGEGWSGLADRARASLDRYFWLEKEGYPADMLLAGPGEPAKAAPTTNALRSNYLLAISMGLLKGSRARRAVNAAIRHLIVPGAVRSLAPLPVDPPLPISSASGHLLNDPRHPYWGTYEGEEDTRRKPAYHNGTAWTWTFPIFCEALAAAWEFSPAAVRAAKAYLASMEALLEAGCVGQIPEILDGDAPHTQRGCDAQAWGVTEALRVWKGLHHPPR